MLIQMIYLKEHQKDAILNRLQHPPVQSDKSLDEIRASVAEARQYALILQQKSKRSASYGPEIP